MALIVNASSNFIEISLDGITDFDSENDLTLYGLAKNAPDGLRIHKITFVPSSAGDQLIVRDRQNGPAMFLAINALGTYDILREDYKEDGRIIRGKLVKPYIHANESIITFPNLAYVIFEI